METSSVEAEYRDMAPTFCELIWLWSLTEKLGFKIEKPIKLYCDSQPISHNANNTVLVKGKKHIEVDCHFIEIE